MKRLLIGLMTGAALLAAPTVLPATANAQATDTSGMSPAMLNDLAAIDRALNSLGSVAGRFAQYSTDGSYSTGAIYISKPGKFRFEYDAPHPLLIVSDGVTITQKDNELETTDRIPLNSTPLHFFLKDDVSLARDTEIRGLERVGDTLQVTVADPSGEMDGNLTLVLELSTMNLREWYVTDTFGSKTRILLSDLRYNERMNPRLFVLRDDSIRDRRDRR